MALSVPPPILSQEGSPATQFGAEKPFDLLCGPVVFDDGTLLTPENALQFGFLIYREILGGTTQVWDENSGTWKPENPPPELQSLFAMDGKWKSILVAIGAKDKASPSGQPKFATDRITQFPRYSAKCFFKGRDAAKTEQSGESSRSQSVEILALGEKDRAGLTITPAPPKPLSEATHISLFLKDASLTERGRVLIEEQSGGFVIELKANGASMKMSQQGEILLSPAAGQKVKINGDLSLTGTLSINGLLFVNGTHVP